MARRDHVAGPGGRALAAKEVAYEYVRREILWDGSNETRFIAEETVGNVLGLSRTPVREAFLRLEAEGLLTLVPRKGAVSVPVTERKVREVMEVRSVIETWSAARIVEDAAARRRVVATMRTLLDELVELGHAADPWAFVEHDRSFHRELVVAAGNEVMLDLCERLRDVQLQLGVRAIFGDPAHIDAVNAEHARIVDALASGDGDDARAAILGHLDATSERLRRRVRDG
jgi:DNA-binding GntR family transcriptional regulator